MINKLKVNSSILCSVDENSIFVLNTASGVSYRLKGEESIMWDLFVRHGLNETVKTMLQAILQQDTESIEALINRHINNWKQNNLID